MIVKNPIIKSALIVFTFWYAVLYIISSLAYGWTGMIWLATDYPVTLGALLIGCSLGTAATLGTRALFLAKQEQITKGGSELRGLRTSLGEIPSPPHPWGDVGAQEVARFHAALHKRAWWPLVSREFPAHASALDAVAAAMASKPSLPASPVPGGHGGRTLFEHSLAVADAIMSMARNWKYTGQRDRRGRLRVKLRDTQGSFHAFRRGDLGLLALAGFAHDFGKLVCYKPTGDKQGRTDLVREVAPNHDTEGAIALRSIPEIMALPYPDRRALLLAVGYYHHAGSIHNGDGITDRMRSLTELLIAADVATGKAEGGVTPDSYGDAYADDVEDYGAAVASPAPTANATVASSAESVPAEPRHVSADAPAPVGAVSAEVIASSSEAEAGTGQHELSLLFRMLADPSAIGARVADQAKRIGWKYGGYLWLIDEAVKHQVGHLAKMDQETYFADVLGVGANDRNGNASPFSARLLTQLHERGLLKVDWNGDELAPQRALFQVRGPKSTIGGIFIVPDTILASTKRLPDDKPMEIVRPLWGTGSAHKKKIQQAAGPVAESGEDVGSQVDTAVTEAQDNDGYREGPDEAIEVGDSVLRREATSPAIEGAEHAEGGESGHAVSLDYAYREFVEAFSADIEFRPDKDRPDALLAVVKKSKNEGAFMGLVSMVEAASKAGMDVSSMRMLLDKDDVPVIAVFPVPSDCKTP